MLCTFVPNWETTKDHSISSACTLFVTWSLIFSCVNITLDLHVKLCKKRFPSYKWKYNTMWNWTHQMTDGSVLLHKIPLFLQSFESNGYVRIHNPSFYNTSTPVVLHRAYRYSSNNLIIDIGWLSTIPISIDKRLYNFYYDDEVVWIEAHFVLECPLYNSIGDRLPTLFQNVILGNLKSFFHLTIKLITTSILLKLLHSITWELATLTLSSCTERVRV